MLASLDVGSNTVRLLIGEVRGNRILPHKYLRRITRLGGGFTPAQGLSSEARERTLGALREYAERISDAGVEAVRAAGTEAFRKAANGADFARCIRASTGLPLAIITGEEEALLTSRGVRAALDPVPSCCLIFDLGGGSTEFILCRNDDVLFHRSYPIGVVSLCEEAPSPEARQVRIDSVVSRLLRDLSATPFPRLRSALTLVGTAGTVTTLAALHLRMTDYDWRRVNGMVLDRQDLSAMAARLAPLTVPEREALPGMEPGRGDLILPGLQLILSLMESLDRTSLTVSDFGLLEGLLLAAAGQPSGRD